MFKKLLSILLCLCLLAAFPLTILAEETEETIETVEEAAPVYDATVSIHNLYEFLTFAESCRLDSYSVGLYVSLECDIDLTNSGFSPIPTFSGTFVGNGHTVFGLTVTCDGSYQGLFRHLEAGALVSDLNVAGTVAPEGSAAFVGGIVGRNSGRIVNCTFTGSVSGGDTVGGIAGLNSLTGTVEECAAYGEVHGSHFVGGIVGENRGVIRACENSAQVNTTVQQNSVELSDITIDTLTGSEASYTVTDIGGIAGGSSGVIRACENTGDVGYPHMGYNIGGIVGSQTGYIVDCVNSGAISGRKEVGGIVGQMEPATYLEFQVDTLQVLEEQIETLSSLTGRATANAQNTASQISGQISAIDDHVDNAKDALGQLVPDPEDPSLPDMDSLTAAQNALGTSMAGITASLDTLNTATQTLAGNFSRDMQAITDQMNVIGQTMNQASENLGGSIYDVSDDDTDEDVTAKIASSVNYGPVLGDWNVGGIVGAVAYENDMDPEDDLEMGGENSLNFDMQVRAVIAGCENYGDLSVKRIKTGGIAGWMYLGLIRDSVNTGAVEAPDADYVGGIAGLSSGSIRGCAAKCVISGDTYVGGIAGEGETVTGCGAAVRLSGTEKLGAVAGWIEDVYGSGDVLPVLGNYYLTEDTDPGAIDGISYSGRAEAAGEEDFFALEELPEVFEAVTVRFVYEDGTVEETVLAYGGALENVPTVPEKAGYTGYWDGLGELDTGRMTFDVTLRAAYTPDNATIQSDRKDAAGLPILLVQGTFLGGETVELEPLTEEDAVESWAFTLPETGEASRFRYRMPQGWEAEQLQLYLRSADGSWRQTEFTADGSYLVFDTQKGDTALKAVEAPKDYSLPILIASAAVVLLLIIGTILLFRKKRKKK